jgi:hypothetical protein
MTNILKIPANTQAYLTAQRDEVEDVFDVVEFTWPYINEIVFPEPWAYWKFEEESGTRFDATGHGRNLLDQWDDGGTPSVDLHGTYGDYGAGQEDVVEWWRQYFYYSYATDEYVLLWESDHYAGSLPSDPIVDTFPSGTISTINGLDPANFRNIFFCTATKDGDGNIAYSDPLTELCHLNPDVLHLGVLTHQSFTAIRHTVIHHSDPDWGTTGDCRYDLLITKTYDYSAGLSRVTGKVAYATQYDASGDGAILNCLSHPDFSSENPFTVAGWIRVGSDDSADVDILIDDLEIYATDGYLGVYTGGSALCEGSISADTYHFFAVTFDGTDLKLFIDADDPIVSAGTTALPSDGDLQIQGYDGLTASDESGVWTQCLTASQVAYLWNGGAGRTLYP